MKPVRRQPTAVIAIGGNSLLQPGGDATLDEQRANVRATCASVAEVLRLGWRVVLTHGNGPQVGDALLRAELAQPQVPPLPLDACGAETQGLIGYLLQQELANALVADGPEGTARRTVVSLVTQVVVAADDPAFGDQTKPVGPFFTPEEALERKRQLGWEMVEDAGRGWRRVVASPVPLEIVELPAIRACLAAGAVVIAGGGGGIPVVRREGKLAGVEAVIDKDRTSALLARALSADLLLFSTGVERVALGFNGPHPRALDRLSIEDARRHLAAGEFPAGSMGPKIEAALEFLAAGNEAPRRAVVTSPERIADAVRGRAGTQIPSADRRQRRRNAA